MDHTPFESPGTIAPFSLRRARRACASSASTPTPAWQAIAMQDAYTGKNLSFHAHQAVKIAEACPFCENA